VAVIELQGSAGVAAARASIGTCQDALADGDDEILVQLMPGTFIETAGMAQLTSWLMSMQAGGKTVRVEGDENVISYMARMNFHRSLGLDEPDIGRNPEGGRFIPIILVQDGNDVFDAVNAIANIVIQQFENVGEFIPAFEWAVNEIVDNVFIHARAETPGVVCAQLFPNKRRLDIAISDCGIGIRGSLSEGFELDSDSAAIMKALERGVTRNIEVGQGNGMAGSLEIMKQNGGKLLVWSGEALYRMEGGAEIGLEAGPAIQGTGVLLSFDLNEPVKLVDTWIGERGWSYIDAEAERVAEEGIKIINACSHTGSRPPATRLRRKIMTLLPEMDGSIRLDFTGVTTLTSSFLDELLGRLNAELGNQVFNDKVIVSGLSELHQNMANNVIGQRLALQDESIDVDSSEGDAAWLIIIDADQTEVADFRISMPNSPEHYLALAEKHWCLLTTTDGQIFGIGRIVRIRAFLDHTVIYFDKLALVEGSKPLSEFGLTGGEEPQVMRMDWQKFEDVAQLFIGHSLGQIALIQDAVYVRDLLELAVRDDLLGPACGPHEDVKDMSVCARYLLGKLAPRIPSDDDSTRVEPAFGVDEEEGGSEEGDAPVHEPGAEFARTTGRIDPDEDALEEIDTTNNQSLVPSSIGLTFCLAPEVDRIKVKLAWGRYERVPNDDHDVTKTRKNKETGEEEEYKVKLWQRIPRGGTVDLSLAESPIPPSAPDPMEPDVRLQGVVRVNENGERVVTLFLVNAQFELEENRDEAWVFQPEIIVEGAREGEGIFLRRPHTDDVVDDNERDRLAVNYRNRLEFAVGHGVSVHADLPEDVHDKAIRVRTEVLPHHEVGATETPGSDPGDRPAMVKMDAEGWMDMQRLAQMEREELNAVLSHLINDYETWISEQDARIGPEVTDFDKPAKELIQRCTETLERLREGLSVLMDDDDALFAFRFANNAMALQRVHGVFARLKRRGDEVDFNSLDIPKNRSWRAFQLAFLLLSIPSLSDPLHRDRTQPVDAFADLLWFPTGGGKTEAYLGVAAFAMSMRRLKADLGGFDGGRGLAVIMRYTLRLLTLQQFQRATTLMCAMEDIRRGDEAVWGAEPFALGLWVGNKVTPGRTEDAFNVIRSMRDQNRAHLGKGSPHQLTSCPWCGSEILPTRNIDVDKQLRRTLIYCGDSLGQCTFSESQSHDQSQPGLPVRVVDEEIYHRPPTMMIATVDKFAMMAWRPEVRNLFGRVTQECERHGLLWPGHDCGTGHHARGDLPRARVNTISNVRPPDLIIQDEFHLISGPLGTMVGLYETAVDELSSWDLEGVTVRPKVVASTATVRRADDQVRNVFMRRVSIFPPSGLDVEDNFFSVQRPVSEQYGRRYMGICAPGSSRPAVLIRVYSAFLMASQDLFNRFGEVADPYMTLVGYFNSLRELGGMRRLAEDDVKTRSFRVEMSLVERPGLAQRKMQGESVKELTSRVSSQDIPKYLDQLEFPYLAKFNDDTEKWEVEWEDEKKPIDIVLATNMLSVGVDVERIGLMVVNGQPKGTAEYIQATSRVGRSHPGIVATVLTWARPRDLSHYETFEHYHSTFYQHVEAQSVTPFSPRALDRGLSGTALSLIRLAHDEFAPNVGAASMDSPTRPEMVSSTKVVTSRTWDVTDDVAKKGLAEAAMKSRADDWAKEAGVAGRTLVFDKYGATPTSVPLMESPGINPWQTWTVPMSMREVEAGVRLILDERTSNSDPGWQVQKPKDDSDEEVI
jgi:hypothetical protein